MIAELLNLFGDFKKGEINYHITQVLELLVRVSEKLSLKLILAKNKNSS